MILIYAYIQKFKNYVEQEISFDSSYAVSFSDGRLSIGYCAADAAKVLVRGTCKPDNIHLLVGKTGSGKTNLLQLIGMKYDMRTQRKWNGEEDSCFLLYKINDREFFAELCDIDIQQFPPERKSLDDLPQRIRTNAACMDSVRTVRFSIKTEPVIGTTYTEFKIIPEYGYGVKTPAEKAKIG